MFEKDLPGQNTAGFNVNLQLGAKRDQCERNVRSITVDAPIKTTLEEPVIFAVTWRF